MMNFNGWILGHMVLALLLLPASYLLGRLHQRLRTLFHRKAVLQRLKKSLNQCSGRNYDVMTGVLLLVWTVSLELERGSTDESLARIDELLKCVLEGRRADVDHLFNGNGFDG